mmetsp:Transcript_87574/g.121552  ORF Transcript_87574/g.121552 Transcript_87574/m.121552 type:complete len:128 (+) Transcript_87574:78-461(+)
MAEAQKSIFERVGGEDAVESVVNYFYEKVLADDVVNHFFKTTDMNKQRRQQKHFMMMAFGGPNKYSGRTMRKAHEHLKLEDKHFDAIGGHLKESLEHHKVPEDIIKEILTVVESTRDDVLCKPEKKE